ncbi:MAG: DUF1592 domain-containing protein [Aureliella sp.]
MRRMVFQWSWLALLAGLPFQALRADDGSRLRAEFEQRVVPFMQRYCLDCHQGAEAEAMLDLTRYAKPADVARGYQTWAELRERLELKEMPPSDSEPQPAEAERKAVIAWIDAFRTYEAEQHAGDPGPVPVRRLSNSETNYSIRDLTGVDIRPTREFPVDPANEAGFDNSAESLTISPALLNKYLAAARYVAEHLVLTPDGIEFAPHPVVTDTDRDKYCVKRIVDFYLRQPTDYADYFYAAWQHRLAGDGMSIEQRAEAAKISPKYLRQIDALLNAEGPVLPVPALPQATAQGSPEVEIGMGPLAVVRRMWRDLPDDLSQAEAARQGCEKLRDFVIDLRKRLEPDIDDLQIRGIHVGSQPFVLWKNGQYKSYRQKPYLKWLGKLSPGADSRAIADALTVPEERQAYEDFELEVRRFCRIFPDAFYISERGRDYVGKPKDQQEKGRLLSAGFHSMMGYYRDDEPLMKLVLDSRQRAELDRLWQELDFVTSAPMRQYTGFVWFERTDSITMRDPEFDFARAEDKSVTTPAMIERLAATYLAKAERLGADETQRAAIEDYFLTINQQIQWVENARRLAEPHHIDALIDFAERAFRRDLTTMEKADLRVFYERLRAEDDLSHEEAVQDVLVSILMSPEFYFRTDLAATSTGRTALSDEELASRLSYFLWSSIPDEALRETARQNRLHEPATLRTEIKRMLADDRISALATEFGGQWLDFRRFEEHNSVDRETFPSFDDQLRTAMFEEPIRFLEHLMREDRSVLECLDADYTIVNGPLAEHYGIALPAGSSTNAEQSDGADSWQVVPARAAGRGGLLTMSVFLTQNAPGRRTSPVKRGYWVVRRLLGEHIPPPPPNVPEIPNDETKLGELTLRETLAKHREHASCAGCHNRIDSIGLVFENYGPIGELREKDLSGNPVDTRAIFPSGDQGEGVDALRSYLLKHRQNDFIENLSRKLLSFALGRTLLLSDEPLLAQMRSNLAANDYRFSSLIETIVLSPQFLQKRGTAEFARE